jgi:hypothetical protein
MKPQYERVTIPDGCSVRVYHRQIAQIPFEWHHHPEYELTLTMNSRGRRFVGDHIADYAGDDLVLVPPDMPHTWASTKPIDTNEPEVAIVVWFSGDWVRPIAVLSSRRYASSCGVARRDCASARIQRRWYEERFTRC